MNSPDWETLEKYKGTCLPHWSCENAIYHVTFRLADSIPQVQRKQWLRERELILESSAYKKRNLTKEEKERLKFLLSRKIQKYLDAGHGECLLREPATAGIVKAALEYFDGQRYYLHAWSIMPNHVHVIVEPIAGIRISKIVHSWKSFTANRINRQLGRKGQLWQHEPFDHIIRSEKEYLFLVEYVWSNPEKAGLKNCPRWRKE